MNNNPVRYSDPTGHAVDDENETGNSNECNLFSTNCSQAGNVVGANPSAQNPDLSDIQTDNATNNSEAVASVLEDVGTALVITAGVIIVGALLVMAAPAIAAGITAIAAGSAASLIAFGIAAAIPAGTATTMLTVAGIVGGIGAAIQGLAFFERKYGG